MIGSCFAENLGARLKQLQFNVLTNPFGIVYHPAPTAQCIDRIISAQPYTANELHQLNELWCSFDHHGRFSHINALSCIDLINSELQNASKQLADAKWLFVSFGTAWAFRLKSTGKIVANCHKFPSLYFDRINYIESEIVTLWSKTIENLKKYNTQLKIVFTVSPIRHLRDGAHENQLSKSTLLLAVHRLLNEHENLAYFPAYEILLDDLRDYRFYEENMTHPNNLAINYIWKRFCETYMTEKTMQSMKTIEKKVKAAAHRPIHNFD